MTRIIVAFNDALSGTRPITSVSMFERYAVYIQLEMTSNTSATLMIVSLVPMRAVCRKWLHNDAATTTTMSKKNTPENIVTWWRYNAFADTVY